MIKGKKAKKNVSNRACKDESDMLLTVVAAAEEVVMYMPQILLLRIKFGCLRALPAGMEEKIYYLRVRRSDLFTCTV